MRIRILGLKGAAFFTHDVNLLRNNPTIEHLAYIDLQERDYATYPAHESPFPPSLRSLVIVLSPPQSLDDCDALTHRDLLDHNLTLAAQAAGFPVRVEHSCEDEQVVRSHAFDLEEWALSVESWRD